MIAQLGAHLPLNDDSITFLCAKWLSTIDHTRVAVQILARNSNHKLKEEVK